MKRNYAQTVEAIMRHNKYTALCVKSNNFVDIIHTDIHEHYMPEIECFLYEIENHDDGFYLLENILIKQDSGQMGDEGRWEIEPYLYIDSCKVKFIMDCDGHITKSEKKYIEKERGKKRVARLQKWVSKFTAADGRTYDVCSLWDGKPALRLRTNGGFTMYETIKKFDSGSSSQKNVKAIRDWISNYFKENGIEPTATKTAFYETKAN